MDNGLGQEVGKHQPKGLGEGGGGPRFGYGILERVPGRVEKGCWQLLIRIWKRVRASDTAPGEDEWFGQGMVHMRLWIPGRDPGLDWAWWLVTVFGKEFV